MGNVFSGWHGRRSDRPYLDELPRIAIGDFKALPPVGTLAIVADGKQYRLQIERVGNGCCHSSRFICSVCHRAVRVLHLSDGQARCPRCTGARYRSTCESSSRRALRKAEAILRQAKTDIHRPGAKPKWIRWPTFIRWCEQADAAIQVIERELNTPYDLIRKADQPKRPRGRPRKVTN